MYKVIKFVSEDVVNCQQWLKDQVSYSADWREQKTAEYPDDSRNEKCARTLRDLAHHIDELPAGHPLFRKIATLNAADNGLLNEWLDEMHYLIPRFGFHKSAISQELVQQLEQVTDKYTAKISSSKALH